MIKTDINNTGKTELDSPLYELEDDSPIYSLNDEEVGTESTDGDDKDIYDADSEDEIDDDATDSEAESSKKIVSPMGVLLKTMMTPVEGWKALKRARFSTDEFASKCFYPLVALATVSEAAKFFYEANYTLVEWMMDGMTTFITFFFGYFTILLAGGFMLPRLSRDLMKKDIGKQFVMLGMSTLAIFWTLIQAVPMLDPVLVFLPLWTIYLIYKGIRVIRVPEEVENSTTGIMCALVIGVLVLWNWLLTEFLIPATVAA